MNKYIQGRRVIGNPIDNYSIGGWIGENKQGVLGGLQAAAGIGAMFIPGMQGFGASMIGGGLGNISGEIQGDRQADMQEDMLAQQEEMYQQNSPSVSSANMQSRYTPTFVRGGEVNPGQQELEGGEVFMTPDGNVQRIDKKAPKHGQKAKSGNTGVRTNLPDGTKILSAREIDPMTNNTYGSAATKDSIFRDKILKAKNKGKRGKEALKRNLTNLNNNFNQAFERQEFGKGGQVMKKYAKGGSVPKYGGDDPQQSQTVGNYNTYWTDTGYPELQDVFDSIYKPQDSSMSMWGSPLRGPYTPSYPQPGQQQSPQTTTGIPSPIQSQTSMGNLDPLTSGFPQSVGPQAPGPITPNINLQSAMTDPNTGLANGENLGIDQELSQGVQGGSGIGSVLGHAAGLAPTVYKAIQGIRKPTQRDPNQFKNPEYAKAIDLMSNRRFNIEPLLEGNRNASRIGRYNLSNAGASAGQQYSGYQGLAAQRMRADASAYSQKQNIDNQYKGEEASMRAGLGSEESKNRYRVDQDNLMAQAARHNYQGAAASQLSQYTQMQQLMNNQKNQSQQQLDILRSQVQYGNKWMELMGFPQGKQG